MKRSIITVFVILLAAIFAAPVFSAISTPIARVNLTKTVVITKEQLQEKMVLYTQEYENIDEATVLDAMISDILFEQALERDGYVLTDEAKNQLLEQQRVTLAQAFGLSTLTDDELAYVVDTYFGATVDEYKDYLAQQYVLQVYVTNMKQDFFADENVLPTNSEIETFYKQNKTSLISAENVKLSHIFFKAGDGQLAKAQDVANQIKTGKITFEKSVSQYSEDADSVPSAGEIGWLSMDDSETLQSMGQNFFDKVFALDAGDISDVIESNAGYHIVKVSVHNDAKLLAIDDKINPADSTTVREYIANYLYQQKVNAAFQNAYMSIISDLKSQATIKYL